MSRSASAAAAEERMRREQIRPLPLFLSLCPISHGRPKVATFGMAEFGQAACQNLQAQGQCRGG